MSSSSVRPEPCLTDAPTAAGELALVQCNPRIALKEQVEARLLQDLSEALWLIETVASTLRGAIARAGFPHGLNLAAGCISKAITAQRQARDGSRRREKASEDNVGENGSENSSHVSSCSGHGRRRGHRGGAAAGGGVRGSEPALTEHAIQLALATVGNVPSHVAGAAEGCRSAAAFALSVAMAAAAEGRLPPQMLCVVSPYRASLKQIRSLGKGGFGSVVAVRSRLDNRVTALKTVAFRSDLPPWAPSEQLERRHAKLLREVQALARLDGSPHVVRYYNAWIEPAWEKLGLELQRRNSSNSPEADQAQSVLKALSAAEAKAVPPAAKGRQSPTAAMATAVPVANAGTAGTAAAPTLSPLGCRLPKHVLRRLTGIDGGGSSTGSPKSCRIREVRLGDGSSSGIGSGSGGNGCIGEESSDGNTSCQSGSGSDSHNGVGTPSVLRGGPSQRGSSGRLAGVTMLLQLPPLEPLVDLPTSPDVTSAPLPVWASAGPGLAAAGVRMGATLPQPIVVLPPSSSEPTHRRSLDTLSASRGSSSATAEEEEGTTGGGGAAVAASPLVSLPSTPETGSPFGRGWQVPMMAPTERQGHPPSLRRRPSQPLIVSLSTSPEGSVGARPTIGSLPSSSVESIRVPRGGRIAASPSVVADGYPARGRVTGRGRDEGNVSASSVGEHQYGDMSTPEQTHGSGGAGECGAGGSNCNGRRGKADGTGRVNGLRGLGKTQMRGEAAQAEQFSWTFDRRGELTRSKSQGVTESSMTRSSTAHASRTTAADTDTSAHGGGGGAAGTYGAEEFSWTFDRGEDADDDGATDTVKGRIFPTKPGGSRAPRVAGMATDCDRMHESGAAVLSRRGLGPAPYTSGSDGGGGDGGRRGHTLERKSRKGRRGKGGWRGGGSGSGVAARRRCSGSEGVFRLDGVPSTSENLTRAECHSSSSESESDSHSSSGSGYSSTSSSRGSGSSSGSVSSSGSGSWDGSVGADGIKCDLSGSEGGHGAPGRRTSYLGDLHNHGRSRAGAGFRRIGAIIPPSQVPLQAPRHQKKRPLAQHLVLSSTQEPTDNTLHHRRQGRRQCRSSCQQHHLPVLKPGRDAGIATACMAPAAAAWDLAVLAGIRRWPYRLYISMELVTGPTLTLWLQQRAERLLSSAAHRGARPPEHPPEPAALERSIFCQIVTGLSYVHAAGVIHRDLKPANIFLVPVTTSPGVTGASTGSWDGLGAGPAAPTGSTASGRAAAATAAVAVVSAPELAGIHTGLPSEHFLVKIGDFGLAAEHKEPPMPPLGDPSAAAASTLASGFLSSPSTSPLNGPFGSANAVAVAATAGEVGHRPPFLWPTPLMRLPDVAVAGDSVVAAVSSSDECPTAPAAPAPLRRSTITAGAKVGTGALPRWNSCSSAHTSGVGTASYSAPEQLLEQPGGISYYGPAVDIYPLGLMLMELFCIHGTAMERANAMREARQGRLPRSFQSAYPREAALAEACLRTLPEQRPSTSQILELLDVIWDSRRAGQAPAPGALSDGGGRAATDAAATATAESVGFGAAADGSSGERRLGGVRNGMAAALGRGAEGSGAALHWSDGAGMDHGGGGQGRGKEQAASRRAAARLMRAVDPAAAATAAAAVATGTADKMQRAMLGCLPRPYRPLPLLPPPPQPPPPSSAFHRPLVKRSVSHAAYDEASFVGTGSFRMAVAAVLEDVGTQTELTWVSEDQPLPLAGASKVGAAVAPPSPPRPQVAAHSVTLEGAEEATLLAAATGATSLSGVAMAAMRGRPTEGQVDRAVLVARLQLLEEEMQRLRGQLATDGEEAA